MSLNPLRIWRSFRAWRDAYPRPTLGQWLRGLRTVAYANGEFIGFCRYDWDLGVRGPSLSEVEVEVLGELGPYWAPLRYLAPEPDGNSPHYHLRGLEPQRRAR